MIADAMGRVPASAKVFDEAATTIVATTAAADPVVVSAWRAAGAEVVAFESDGAGGVELPGVLTDLGKRDVQGLLVEGGARIAWSFVRDGLVDRVVCYVAPKFVGGTLAPGALGGEGFAPIGSALELRFERVDRIGDDLRVEADVHRHR